MNKNIPKFHTSMMLMNSPFKWVSQSLVRNRILLMGLTAVITLLLTLPASRVQIDGSGVSFSMNDSRVHQDYLEFAASFGTDDYIILAVKNTLDISDPELKNRIGKAHRELVSMDMVLQVISLSKMASSGLFNTINESDFWSNAHISKARQNIPGLARLISKDLGTIAFIVKINNENINGFQLEKQLAHMKDIVAGQFLEHPHCYLTGIPVIRAAFERYNLRSAIVFGAMGLLFGILIAFYIFRTPWVAAMVIFASVVSLIWVMGIMGLANIDLNLATGLSFGFILVVSTTTVFHIATAYFHLLKTETDDTVLLKTFQRVLPACFMCALTTSTGFLSLAVSTIPMVRQAGIVISSGVMTAFFLTIIITAFFLPLFFSAQRSHSFSQKANVLGRFIKTGLFAGFKTPHLSVVLGLFFIVSMALAIPEIQSVKHLTNRAIENTREADDLEYIEQHLFSGTSFSVILQPDGDYFATRKFWYDLAECEKRVQAIPGVLEVESLTKLVFRLALGFPLSGIKPEKVFDQILVTGQGSDIIQRYYNQNTKKIRLIVHIQNQTSDQIEATLSQVDEITKQMFAGNAVTTLSGQLILLKSQTTDLVSSQVKTIVLALFVITMLMVIQLKSVVLGILSLIPNLFPLVTIFGIMGWFHIPLDPLTIFAAIISFGLSVDDSIHYLTHLKRQMAAPENNHDIRACLIAAYEHNARALVSTTAVLFFAALGLLFSSLSHVHSLGILISAASVAALLGDLVFMPALILTFKPLKVVLTKKLQEAVL